MLRRSKGLPTSDIAPGERRINDIKKIAIHLKDVTKANIRVEMTPVLFEEEIEAANKSNEIIPIAEWSVPEGEIDTPRVDNLLNHSIIRCVMPIRNLDTCRCSSAIFTSILSCNAFNRRAYVTAIFPSCVSLKSKYRNNRRCRRTNGDIFNLPFIRRTFAIRFNFRTNFVFVRWLLPCLQKNCYQ